MNVTLHLGDCLEYMRTLESGSVDCVVTSPPYDNLRTYGGHTWDFEGVAQQLFRVVKDGGVVVWVIGDETSDGSETGTSFRQALGFMECGFKLHDTMIYEKNNFSHPSKTRYHQLFEYIFILSSGTPQTFNPLRDKKNKWVGTRTLGRNTMREADGTLGERKRPTITEYGMRGNVWRGLTSGQEDVCGEQIHPATMPRWLTRDLILSWSNKNDTVFDPFTGSGTTGIEAVTLGRNFIGAEIHEPYYRIAERRIREAQLQIPLDMKVAA
jgi:DNA modification methylase